MKYLILSDIHGSLPRLQEALKFYHEQKCDMLCLLGDILNYGPRNRIPDGLDAKGVAELLNALADDIVCVRGNCDSEVDQMLLQFPIMSDYILLVDADKRILLTHGHVYNKENLPPGRFDAVFYGHTHRWELSRMGDTVICNTGSITFPKDGKEPTMAILEHGCVTVYNLDGKPLTSMSL